jgi:hypothetical protein
VAFMEPTVDQLLAVHSRFIRRGATDAQWLRLAARFELAAQRVIERPMLRSLHADCLGRVGLSVDDVA